MQDLMPGPKSLLSPDLKLLEDGRKVSGAFYVGASVPRMVTDQTLESSMELQISRRL